MGFELTTFKSELEEKNEKKINVRRGNRTHDLKAVEESKRK